MFHQRSKGIERNVSSILDTLLKGEVFNSLVKGIEDVEEKVLVYSALLHDIGHHPFSHLGEEILSEIKKSVRDTTELYYDSENGRMLASIRAQLYEKEKKPHEVESYELVIRKKFIRRK